VHSGLSVRNCKSLARPLAYGIKTDLLTNRVQ